MNGTMAEQVAQEAYDVAKRDAIPYDHIVIGRGYEVAVAATDGVTVYDGMPTRQVVALSLAVKVRADGRVRLANSGIEMDVAAAEELLAALGAALRFAKGE